jgi:surfeit locus 1 family protein
MSMGPIDTPSSALTGDGGPAPRPIRARILIGGLVAVCVAALIGLGIWQLERLGQKLALIDRVDHRIHAEPIDAPGPARWPEITSARDEYVRVRIAGHFLNDRETPTQAVTDYGGGYWIMTPLRTDGGFTVLVNRGFVPSDKRDASTRPAGQPVGDVVVTGLMRMTEPRGGFLRSNDPTGNRWYSRDVAAIAEARGLTDVAPYFVDADATPNTGGLPIGGLTVIRFANNHLVYALTWFGLAAGLIAAVIYVRLKRSPTPGSV